MVAEFARPVQERTRGYLEDPAQLDKLLGIGAEKARSIAVGYPANVYESIGFLPAGTTAVT